MKKLVSQLEQYFDQKSVAKRWPWLFGGVMLTGLLIICPLILLMLALGSFTLNGLLVWQFANLTAPPIAASPKPPLIVVVPPGMSAASTAIPTATGLIPPPTSTPGLPTPTPHLLDDYTIDKLRSRVYPGGQLEVRSILTATNNFTSYYIDYPSDGLTITGIMQIPPGEGPFPVIILNHGYIDRAAYWPGADTWRAASYLNQHGYLTIAPDFRSWGESDTDNSFFSTGQLIDTLNLISSLESVPEADINRVGMWGHSMGGGITMKAITIDYRIRAAVLYAPVSADDAQVIAQWGPGCHPEQPNLLSNECAGAEVLVANMDDTLFWAYADAIGNAHLLARTSPINYADYVIAPVQIHIGTADTRTPPTWAADINDRLRARGKTVEYFSYPNQGHALQGQSWDLFMQRTVDFFDRNLTSDPSQ